MSAETVGPATASRAGQDQGKPPLSEAQYLANQAAEAKAAISRSLSDLKAEFGHIANPSELTRKHPWLSMGAAAVAAFLATSAIVPSKEEQALRRLSKLEAALCPPSVKEEANGNHKSDGKHASWLQTLLQELLKSLGPILGTVISSFVSTPSPADPSQQNGATSGGVTPPPAAGR